MPSPVVPTPPTATPSPNDWNKVSKRKAAPLLTQLTPESPSLADENVYAIFTDDDGKDDFSVNELIV